MSCSGGPVQEACLKIDECLCGTVVPERVPIGHSGNALRNACAYSTASKYSKASFHHNTQAMELVAGGADAAFCDKLGRRPLHYAAAHGHAGEWGWG
eukprot:1161024-Pelagomonas_calceolata.AAC.3